MITIQWYFGTLDITLAPDLDFGLMSNRILNQADQECDEGRKNGQY